MTEHQDKEVNPQATSQDDDKTKQPLPVSTKSSNKSESSVNEKKRGILHSRKRKTKADTPEKKTVGQYAREQRRSRINIFISILTLTIALTSIYGIYWLWNQGMSEAERLASKSQLIDQEVVALKNQFLQAQQNNQAQRQSLQQQLVTDFDSQLEALRKQDRPEVEPNWLLSESEYLIRIADHRLQLAGDVDTAISALMLADERLQVLREPRVLNARRQLKNDINQLRALPEIDTVGIALTLSSLQNSVSSLPLNKLSQKIEPGQAVKDGLIDESKSWAGFFDSIVTTLKSLVTIRRVNDQTIAVVPPEQSGFLIQNLSLKLEAARYSLLTHDEQLFHQSLRVVSEWLERYFDQNDSAVQSMQLTLQSLVATKIHQELPNLGASLKAVMAINLQSPLPVEETKSGSIVDVLTGDEANLPKAGVSQ